MPGEGQVSAASAAACDCSFTPPQVLALLLELLACNDNSSNPLDDGHWLAGLVAGLGQLRLRHTGELAKVNSTCVRRCVRVC